MSWHEHAPVGSLLIARSTMTESIATLWKGLNALAALPDGPWRRQQELDLQIALGTALAATKGASADEVGATLARARALAEQIDRREHLGPLSVRWDACAPRSDFGVSGIRRSSTVTAGRGIVGDPRDRARSCVSSCTRLGVFS